MDFNNVVSITIGDKQVKNIMFSDGNIVWESKEIEDDDKELTPLYIENVSDSDGRFSVLKGGSPTYTPNLMYRIGDNGEWFEYDVATSPKITVPSKSKIYLKGDNPTGFNQANSSQYGYSFRFSNAYNIGGYLTSLLALDNFNTITDIPNYCFRFLFSYEDSLRNVKDLITDNIINVGNNSFEYFLNKTDSFTIAPTFKNVTTVGNNGFDYCFEGCTSLKTVYAPNISTWNTSNFTNWLSGVSSTGIIYKSTGLEIPTGNSGIPTGWTTVDY